MPEPYRLQNRFIDAFYGPETDAGRGAELTFTDRAAELGVDTFDAGKGVAVEDFDGDGFLDIVTGGSFDELRFYRNGNLTTPDETLAIASLGDSASRSMTSPQSGQRPLSLWLRAPQSWQVFTVSACSKGRPPTTRSPRSGSGRRRLPPLRFRNRIGAARWLRSIRDTTRRRVRLPEW